jgi:hypothetical protein
MLFIFLPPKIKKKNVFIFPPKIKKNVFIFPPKIKKNVFIFFPPKIKKKCFYFPAKKRLLFPVPFQSEFYLQLNSFYVTAASRYLE